MHPHLSPEDRVSEQKFKENITEKFEKTQLTPRKQLMKIKYRKQMKNVYRQHSAKSEEQSAKPHTQKWSANICNNSRTRFFGEIKKHFGEWNLQNAPPPPRPFLQIYAIFGSSETWKVPIVWAFIMQKSEETYQKFFKSLTQKCLFFKLAFNVKIILANFEIGIMPSIEKVFHVTRHLGWWFHYTQFIFRKPQELGFSRQNKKWSDPALDSL